MTDKRRISFSPPDITQSEIDEVVDSLKSGWITTGPKTKRFERELEAFTTSDRVATFSSATAASVASRSRVMTSRKRFER